MAAFFSTERTQTEALEYLEAHGMQCKVIPQNVGELNWQDLSLTAAVACGHDFGFLFGIGSRWYAVAMIDSHQRVASFRTEIVCSICP